MSSVCASRQNKFEEMHESLFKIPSRLDEENLIARTVELGLDSSAFRRCMNEPDQQVEADIAEARALKIASTPTFLIGPITGNNTMKVSRVVTGAKPLEEFRSAVKAVMERQQNIKW